MRSRSLHPHINVHVPNQLLSSRHHFNHRDKTGKNFTYYYVHIGYYLCQCKMCKTIPMLDTPDNSLPMFDSCEYTDDCDKLLDETCGTCIMHLNIHGLHSKLDELKDLLDRLNNVLNETLTRSHHENLLQIDGYDLILKNHCIKKGGGIGMYINSKLDYTTVDTDNYHEEGKFEIMAIDVKTRQDTCVTFLNVYRPPNTSEPEFNTKLSNLLKELSSRNRKCVFAGDFNLDLLKVNQHKQTSLFLENMLGNNMLPCITLPTRVTHQTATLIDNVFVDNSLGNTIQSYVLKECISDHYPCLLLLGKSLKCIDSIQEILTRNLNKDSILKIKTDIKQTDWGILDKLDCNRSMNIFHGKLLEIIDRHAPEKYVRITSKRIKVPWLTAGLIQSSHNMRKLFNKSKNNSTLCTKYRQYRSLFNKLKRLSKKQYYADRLLKIGNDGKKIWLLMNQLIGRSHDKSKGIEKLELDNIVVTDKKEIANSFSSYFANIGKQYADRIPRSKTTHKKYLPPSKRNKKSIFLSPIDTYETKHIINSLPNKTSHGLDGISNILLKKLVDEISVPLTNIFQLSITEGVFPEILKKAKITPLHKSKERYFLNNY